MNDGEWEIRFKARLVERLLAAGAWLVHAEEAADVAFVSRQIDAQRESNENDPENAADEELSNWSKDEMDTV
jgi:hypothetical protein